MNTRELGSTGIQVPELGFGCSRIGGIFSGGADDPLRVIDAALDIGITLFDTADMYSQGESERLLGRALKGRRDRAFVATKAGYCLPGRRKLISCIKPLVKPVIQALGIKRDRLPTGTAGALSQNFEPAYLQSALEASLQRLSMEWVDLIQLHSPSPEVIRAGEAVSALQRLKGQGKARLVGIAADCVADAEAALEMGGFDVLQMPFGLLDLEALDRALPLAFEKRIGVIARGCFGGGLLKQGLTESDLRARTEKWPRVMAIRGIAKEQGRGTLDLALQFTLATPGVSTVILGMHSQNHVQSNIGLYAGVPLTVSVRERLAAIR